MGKSSSLLSFAFLLFLPFPSLSQNPNDRAASAHTALLNGSLPPGLLPAGVLSYALNRTSGDFSVDFGAECRVLLPPGGYVAAYSRRVTGRLLAGRVAELEGVRVRAFFRWWSITGIRSSGEDLVFEVGVTSAKYPRRNFEQSLPCEGTRSVAAA